MSLNINIKEKKYGSKVILRNVNIDINKGGIIGVVGKNGQGKTTFLKCILGNLKYKGAMIFNNVKLKINDVAWCPTQPLIYDDLTAAEFKKFYAELLKIKGEPKKDLFEIPQNILIKEFSTGMKKKAYLNAIFQKQYPIYLMDEPFNGLDMESNYKLIRFLTEKKRNSIVIISSHIMGVLYNNCSSIFAVQDAEVVQFKKDKFKTIENYLFD